MIKITNLNFNYKSKQLFNGLNMEIEKGKITGIIGRNGSGKTVLLKMLVQLYYPSSGEITYINGIDVTNDFGVLIDTGFLENETGFKNLYVLSSLKGKIKKNEIYDIMNYVKLDPWSKTKYKNYSTGMKQKLKLAQALMEKPSVLILDEPFNGLDQESVSYFREELLKLKQKGVTMIITSHFWEDIEKLCDIVYEMKDGVLKKNEKRK